MKAHLLKALPHIAAIVVFVILSSTYFSPVWEGYDLRQGDIANWRGMSKEILDYRLLNDKEPLWTDNAFSGMPAYQISVQHNENVLKQVDLFLKLYLPGPVGVLFMCMLGFYIFGLCLRVNPWLCIVGAIGFGLGSINILFLDAGHTAKVNAIAFMAPALGGLILAFRGRILLGGAVFALFFGLNIAANHLQMTYYLVMLLALVALGEVIRLAIEKQFITAAKAIGILAVAGILAVLPSAGNLLTTYEYSKYTTRGATDLTITPDGSEKNKTAIEGLDSDYMLQYNFGKGEAWSTVIPNARGGQSAQVGRNKDLLKSVPKELKENIAGQNQYWGEQLYTGGAFYFGAALMFLFALGFVFAKDNIRWAFLVATFLALMLCQKDMNAINHLFIDKFPMYNKFRDSKMILVLLQLMAPAMMILMIQRFFQDETIFAKKKFVLIGCGVGIAVLITMVSSPKIMGSYMSSSETEQFDELIKNTKDTRQVAMIEDFEDSLIDVRVQLFKQDAQRSLLFVICAAAVVALLAFKVIKPIIAVPILGILVLADIWTVDQRYLNSEHVKGGYESYTKNDDKALPHQAEKADLYILEKEKGQVANFDQLSNELKNKMVEYRDFKGINNKEGIQNAADFGALNLSTNYRVLTLGDPFSDGRTSYFHKSIGGYHGAKLKAYQELIDFHLKPEMKRLVDTLKSAQSLAVLKTLPAMNMLNTKYIVYNPSAPPIENPEACGNAWFVDQVQVAPDANAEILAINGFDPKHLAYVQQSFSDNFKSPASVDSTWNITLTEYGTNILKYTSHSTVDAPAVFSEIYYPQGWVCRIDGKDVPYVKTDYVLRGVMVPAGDHTIEWSFEPKVYTTGKTMSYTGSALILLFVLGIFGWDIKKGLSSNK